MSYPSKLDLVQIGENQDYIKRAFFILVDTDVEA
jgi:hypothetical protein